MTSKNKILKKNPFFHFHSNSIHFFSLSLVFLPSDQTNHKKNILLETSLGKNMKLNKKKSEFFFKNLKSSSIVFIVLVFYCHITIIYTF